MKTIKTIDLFAGIGGMRIGVELAARSLKLKHKNVFSQKSINIAVSYMN